LMAVSPRTIRRLVDDGALRAIRVGSTLAVTPDALPSPLSDWSDGEKQVPLLTLHDVAEILHCSPRRVRDLTATRVFKGIRIGGSERWSPKEVDALAEGKEAGDG